MFRSQLPRAERRTAPPESRTAPSTRWAETQIASYISEILPIDPDSPGRAS